jgi:hypothetical protein
LSNFLCAGPRREGKALVILPIDSVSNENCGVGRILLSAANTSQVELSAILNGSSYADGHHVHDMLASPVLEIALRCNILEETYQGAREYFIRFSLTIEEPTNENPERLMFIIVEAVARGFPRAVSIDFLASLSSPS